MKKLLIIAGSFLLILPSNAQRNKVDDTDTENFFRIGAKAGVNVNKLAGKSYRQFAYNYQLGTFLQFNFSRRFGIQPEVNFTQAVSSYTNDVTEIFDDLARDGNQRTQRLNYLEIPILLNINVGESRHVKLQAGPSYGIPLGKTVTDPGKEDDKRLIFKNGELSVMGGLWIQVPFVNVGARYKMGLSNVNTDTGTWKNQAIQVFVGFTF